MMQRIAAARKRSGMTQQELSEFLAQFGVSISKAAAAKWETGETVPNAYQLMDISAALGMDECMRNFSKKSVSLLNEDEEKKVMDYRSDLIASGKYRPMQKRTTAIRYIEILISTLAASAGTGAFLDEGNFEMVSFPEKSVPKGADFGVRVSGNSMEPVYHDGQIVWVQECDSIGIDEVGIFILNVEGYIKSYDEQEPDEDIQEEYVDTYGVLHAQPVLVSFNKAYAPRVISPHSEFRFVGRVLN